MWQRFTYNGASSKQQAVFFFNLKEIMDNKFGTPAPVPFQDWSHPIPNQMTGTLTPLRVEVKCFGKYTFKITDPATFMNEVSGTADVYKKTNLVEQMRSEVISSFQNVLNELGNSNHKVPVLELPSQTDEIKEIMDNNVFDAPIRRRGIALIGFTVESVTLDDESEKKIDNYELSSNSFMQQGTLVGAYANAVQDAANNANGATNGFVGIGMVNMSSNGMMSGTNQGPWQQDNSASRQNVNDAQNTVATQTNNTTAQTWVCPNCKTETTGKFCSECGTKKAYELVCKKCGTKIAPSSKFCPECGEKC